jgi:ABC-type molybdenum transport system ATPase subunit/photorepair protein PhrA
MHSEDGTRNPVEQASRQPPKLIFVTRALISTPELLMIFAEAEKT